MKVGLVCRSDFMVLSDHVSPVFNVRFCGEEHVILLGLARSNTNNLNPRPSCPNPKYNTNLSPRNSMFLYVDRLHVYISYRAFPLICNPYIEQPINSPTVNFLF